MTREQLQFLLPVVFPVGPDVRNSQVTKGDTAIPEKDKVSSLEKYAMLLPNPNQTNGSNMLKIVKDIIEGETRVLVSSMTMEQILADLNSFKRVLSNNVQAELGQYGLKVYNGEVKELR
jgi:flotillin